MARRTVRYLVITPLEAEMARRTVAACNPAALCAQGLQPYALMGACNPRHPMTLCVRRAALCVRPAFHPACNEP
eukprot:scaffold108668_cov36-Phaeocystis_antarctica.AAC.2